MDLEQNLQKADELLRKANALFITAGAEIGIALGALEALEQIIEG